VYSVKLLNKSSTLQRSHVVKISCTGCTKRVAPIPCHVKTRRNRCFLWSTAKIDRIVTSLSDYLVELKKRCDFLALLDL